MGDRCYMSVTCRREDKARFEELGFEVESETSPESLIIEMVDQEANYAHADQMPKDIPYTCWHGAGGNYGDGKIVCDGRAYAEVCANNDGFVLAWDYQKMRPRHKSILQVRRFIKLEKRVQARFKVLREQAGKTHLFSPDTHLCVKCGIHADDDLVENQPCIK